MRSRSPKSTYDELERAVADMRANFLSIGEQIADLLRTLAWQIDAIPAQASATIRFAAGQIAGTQQRLKAQMARLPTRPDQRFQIMRSLLQAQQGALQQLTLIVEQNAQQAGGFGHHGPDPYAHGGDPVDQEIGYDWANGQRGAAMAGHELADAHFESAWSSSETAPPSPRARASKRPAKVAAERAPGRTRRRGASLIEAMSSRALAVVAVLVAGAVAAYVFFPEAAAPSRARDRGPPATSTAVGSDTATEPAREAAADATTQADVPDTAERKALPMPGIIVSRPESRTGRLPEAGSGDRAAAREDTQARLPTLDTRPVRDAAPDERGTGAAPARKSATAAVEPEAAPAEPAKPLRFVAVVFTHQDRAAALGEFTDLQQRYPALLARRKAEAQPIELGDKGVWHRVAVLPAGTRQQASNLCDQLQAAGYERCWVKAY